MKASYIGSKIFEAEHVSKSFGDLKIVEDFNYVFARYEKMGIVGNNGTGKSTFIKMLMGEVEPDSGRFDVGETVRLLQPGRPPVRRADEGDRCGPEYRGICRFG